jgi:hypothetical protein
MHLNLQKWFFPCKNIHAKIFEKCIQQVDFPKDFIWRLERHKEATVAVSMGARILHFEKGSRARYS